jgi:CheY-like chemotaxis protein
MKSRRCSQCNVSSARYTWGFALLARDGWGLSMESASTAAQDDAWSCPACCGRNREAQQCLGKPQAPKAAARARSRPRGKLRVLLVDDEEMVRRCTARLLSDFDVVSVGSGTEALELLARDADFDVVLSDVMMPTMSGPELYMRCHATYPLLAQRFVFASGNPESARLELRCAVQGVAADLAPILLTKPSSREALLLSLFAVSAQTASRSGTYSSAELVALEVTKYRG